MSYSLIVPVAADNIEYEKKLPYLFGLSKDGIIICIKSILGLDLSMFSKIYFTILKKHDDKFFVADSLNMQLKRLGINTAKVVILDDTTSDESETVYRTIKKENITGPIFIKDGDCFFDATIDTPNGVAIYPIEELEFLDPRNKSYVAVDDMFYITNIIEKSVIGHYISAGGYAIEDASIFCNYYDRLRSYGKLYLSHLIYSMLLDNKTFRPIMVKEYKDWGSRVSYTLNQESQW